MPRRLRVISITDALQVGWVDVVFEGLRDEVDIAFAQAHRISTFRGPLQGEILTDRGGVVTIETKNVHHEHYRDGGSSLLSLSALTLSFEKPK